MKKNTLIRTLLSGCLLAGALACTDMDEYRKISGDGERVYPGKIVDAEVLAGDGRVVVRGLCNSDPKITVCRITWNLGTEYVDVAVDMSSGSYLVEREIALAENTYNFDLYTFDARGNRSIPVNVSGRSYGEQYKAAITNRLVRSVAVTDEGVRIEWWDIDTTQGPFATEVVYTDASGVRQTVEVPVDESTTLLAGCDGTREVVYTTLYRPEATAVDLFRSPSDRIMPQQE